MGFVAEILHRNSLTQVAEEITSQPQFHEPVPVFLTIMMVILVAPLISEYLKLPAIVGLIIGGIIVGPSGLHLLDIEATIELFSTVGLIYLMFVAGLEIDIHQLGKVRTKALVFTLLTMIIPIGVGFVISQTLLGLESQGALLLGIIFATQTLVAFPVVQQLGISRDEAVAVAVGATAIIDVVALLILAAMVGGHHGEGGSASITDIVQLLVLMSIYTFVILWGLPRLGRLFFSRFSGHSSEFQFVLVVIFVAAYVAEFIGMEAIVGAFLAGLAINTTLPHRSPVVGRVMFMGEAFFIPIFLMYIGMITDPISILTDMETLLTGVVITVATFATKFLAAWITGRLFNYGFERIQLLFGLSLSHAAVALASVEIGIASGIFSGEISERIFSGIIMMVLLTCFASSLLVKHYGLRIPVGAAGETRTPRAPLFERILIPVANPQTEEDLLTLAGILAREHDGTLIPLNVALDVDGHVVGLDNQKLLMEARSLNDPDTRIQPVWRIGTSVGKSILHVAIESGASLIVMGWRGEIRRVEERIFGTVLDEVVRQSSIPVMVSRLNMPINAKRRVILVIPHNSMLPGGAPTVLDAGMTVAAALNVPLYILTDEYAQPQLEALVQESADQPVSIGTLERDVVEHVTRISTPNDLLLVTSVGSPQLLFQSSLGRIAETLAEMLPASLVVIHFPDQE